MGLKLSRTRPGRALLGLKSSRTRNGVKIEPDETLIGLKLTQTRNGVKLTGMRHRLDLIKAKINPDEKWGLFTHFHPDQMAD